MDLVKLFTGGFRKSVRIRRAKNPTRADARPTLLVLNNNNLVPRRRGSQPRKMTFSEFSTGHYNSIKLRVSIGVSTTITKGQ
jgi:hypothetical protein